MEVKEFLDELNKMEKEIEEENIKIKMDQYWFSQQSLYNARCQAVAELLNKHGGK